MKIYDTMTKTKREFVPLDEGKVKIYVCGPTVYNLIHIGNARPMIFFDTVRRYFIYKGYDVKFVSNFTDVDDKIINKAMQENVSADMISERYINECKKDMQALNILPADVHPLATKEIDGMIDMIAELIKKGHAYNTEDGTVYFRTLSFKDYGKLSHKNIDDLQSGFRELKVSGEDKKENSGDFVLWKPKKEGEPYWSAPWCKGRPGWHIECSLMSKKYLGEQIDIHGGGEDLIFPHHENEIAQSECCSGKKFANYWMHNAFLNINNKKMSKSEGNFFTVRDISEKYDLQILRFFMLNAHYRNPLNFSEELMAAAKNSLERILTAYKFIKDKLEAAYNIELKADENEYLIQIKELKNKFEQAMEDDFNTADAISSIFEIVKIANISINKDSSKYYIENTLNILIKLCDILGLILEKEDSLDLEVEKLIEERTLAKKNKDFGRADEIREILKQMNIALEDTREGVKWKRI